MDNNEKFKILQAAGRFIDATSDRTIWDDVSFNYQKLKFAHAVDSRIRQEKEALEAIKPVKKQNFFKKLLKSII